MELTMGHITSGGSKLDSKPRSNISGIVGTALSVVLISGSVAPTISRMSAPIIEVSHHVGYAKQVVLPKLMNTSLRVPAYVDLGTINMQKKFEVALEEAEDTMTTKLNLNTYYSVVSAIGALLVISFLTTGLIGLLNPAPAAVGILLSFVGAIGAILDWKDKRPNRT